MNEFPGFTHVAVTVSDLARSTAWYADLFGSAPVLDEDVAAGSFHHTVFAIGGGNLFGLHLLQAGDDRRVLGAGRGLGFLGEGQGRDGDHREQQEAAGGAGHGGNPLEGRG